MQCILVSVVCAALISLSGFFFSSSILALMGASEEAVREGSLFTQIMLGGSVVITVLFMINGIFGGAGYAAIAMKSLWLASVINILLCPLLISTFHLGLKGAAIATTLGRGAGVIYQCYYLWKGNALLTIKTEYLKPHFETIRSIIRIAWPATLQFIIASASWIFLARLVAETGGTAASAG